MAYALRYYKEMTQADGSTIRLEIHKKDSTSAAIEIGAVVQGLSLEIQGSQGDVDSPIVKTSLSMTFVDASDIENGQKNGFWEEFYTPDALLWKVVLMAKDAQETAFRTIWGGYVTPDSFSEDLVYRGSVSIIARDNIGHMQDFPFDAEGDADGLISLRNLVSMAWEKIASPMDLIWDTAQMMVCEGVSALDTLMNVSQFEEKDWYKAVETALASYGMVMRYTGDNEVHIGALRYLPNLGYVDAGSVPHLEPVFVTGAQRELVPAVRRIEESVDYELAKDFQPKVTTRDFSGNIYDVETSWGVVEDIAWGLIESTPMYAFGWYNEVPYKTLAFNPNGYEADDNLTESDRENLFGNTCILTGTKDDDTYSLSYLMTVGPEDFAINVQFGRFFTRWTNSAGYHTIGFPLTSPTSFVVRYAIKAEFDGGILYLTQDGEWSDTFVTRTIEVTSESMAVDVPLSGNFAGNVMVSLVFLNIDTGEDAVKIKQILGISLSDISTKPMREKNTVNTVYNADNNVVLSRGPEIGPAYDSVALPAFIKNGIFVRSGDEILPARNWGWSGGSVQQMAVWNHLQLLCYYAKPNNLISGSIVNADMTRVQTIYEWHGAEHMLVSGRYNFLRGQIESAVLREFARYEDMWSEVAGAAMPETEEDSTTNVEGSASSGGSSSTYTNTTAVNIGTGGSGGGASYLDDLLDVNVGSVTAQSILYYNGTEWVAQTKSAFLDGVTDRVSTLEGFWYDEDGVLTTDKVVRIKNNLIVTGDTASGGEGEDTPAIGTVTGVSVNGVEYSDVTAGILDLSDAFNGITVDLSGHYTKQEVDNKIAGLNISQYATVTALNAVSDRVLTLENAGYATTGYVDTKIANLINGAPTTLDTLKEIADALAENEDVVDALEAAIGTKANASDLTALAARVTTNEGSIASLSSGKADKATTLAGYGITNAYTKTEVDGKVTTINTSITAVSNRVTTLESWKTDIAKYITIVDGNVKISTNLIVSGDTASGGDGEDTAAIGTVTGIKVNGTTYNPTAGIVTIPDYPTTLEWNAISGKPSFATVATSGSYDDLSNKPTIPSLAGYATETWVSGRYLPLSGGTLSGGLTLGIYDLKFKGSDTGDIAWFDEDNNEVVRLYNNGGVLSVRHNAGTTYAVIHGGNIGSQSVKYATSAGSAPASDVYAWAKASAKPAYTTKEVTESGNLYFTNARAVAALTDTLASYATQSWVEGKKYITASAIPTLYVLTIKKADGTTLVAFDPEEEDKTITLGKADVGLGNVDNLAASGYLTALSSNTTNAVSITVGGTTKTITVATMKTSLGLGSLAYLNSLSKSDVGLGNVENKSSATIRGEITSANVTTALGYTPYNATNPNGYISGITSAMVTTALGYTPANNASLANYLPLTGGMITGNGAALLAVNRQDGNPVMEFRYNGSLMGRYGFATDGTPIGVVGGSQVTLIHSGNIGSYAFLKAATKLTSSDTLDADLIGLYAYQDGANPTNSFGDNAAVLSLKGTKANPTFQLAFAGNEGTIGYKVKTTSGIWQSWKTIAFTNSNVASATKLATARTIWGQSFDGTGNVADPAIMSYLRFKNIDDTSTSYIGRTASADNDIRLYIATDNGFRIYTNGVERFILNSSGNVTIGSSDLAGTSAKLYVNGNTTINGVLDVNNSVEINNGSLTIVKGQIIRFHNTTDNTFIEALGFRGDSFHIGYGNRSLYDTYVQGNNIVFRPGAGTEAMRLDSSGNVGIGTTSPAYKLDVAGTGRFTSTLTVGGATTIGGALTASSTILASSVICGTTRLRVNASDNAGNFGYMRVETVSSNRGLLHIGANYGGSTTITNVGVDVDAIGIYRGVVGIGRTYTYDELYANQAAGLALRVAGGAKVDGALTVGAGATIAGNSTINGNLVVTGDVASA